MRRRFCARNWRRFERMFRFAIDGGGRCRFVSDDLEGIRAALVLAIADFAAKTGFRKITLGLSGGVDSALVAALAAEALGGENVVAAMMPSRYTAAASIEDARRLAQNLGLEYLEIPIDGIVATIGGAVEPFVRRAKRHDFRKYSSARARRFADGARQQPQLAAARDRQQSELACGYATLYGDMAGGFAPLMDVSKTRVWEIAKLLNREREMIPPRIIERAPSAELRPDQVDQDSLPPYALIDEVVRALLEDHESPERIGRRLEARARSCAFRFAGGERIQKAAIRARPARVRAQFRTRLAHARRQPLSSWLIQIENAPIRTRIRISHARARGAVGGRCRAAVCDSFARRFGRRQTAFARALIRARARQIPSKARLSAWWKHTPRTIRR